MITWVRSGDLLSAQADALVNPVNTRGVMGRGLAAQFKERFPDHYQQYRRACESGEVRLGKVLVTQARSTPELTVIHFPTKDHWRSRSRLSDIESGLVDLRGVAVAMGLQSMAVPALGCGLGGLQWADVKPLLVDALQDVSTEALIYIPQEQPHHSG